eukprot:1152723-Pelagomonas_calceolata.AAC.2
MGMKFASKFIGALVVKHRLFELIEGVFNITSPAYTQKDGMESHNFCINEFAEVCLHAAAVPPPTGVSLVSSQYLISNKCTCRWFTFSWWGCLTRLAVVVLCVGWVVSAE